MMFLKRELGRIIERTQDFTGSDYKERFNEFTRRFPIIGSSTHSITNSLKKGELLDYVIIDEASQQDIIPGILSLGCAKNVIVVGDQKQLPHIAVKSNIAAPDPAYDCMNLSFLDSFINVFEKQAPTTLLKEHYRCHPRIIQFCNQQYYNNELIPMTSSDSSNPLEMIVTAKGNHMRNNSNLREIESLMEVGLGEKNGVGFIAPYNNQVSLAGEYLPADFIRDTIHKFQGRDCEKIVFSTVLDKKMSSQGKLDFVDDAHLVNVAVSRAIDQFTLVTGEDVFTANNKSLAALTRYINYYASDEQVHRSPVISGFDLLYAEYDQALESLNRRLEKRRPKVSEYKSEQIMYEGLQAILTHEKFSGLTFHSQIDLSQLVSVRNSDFTRRELEFMRQRASCDFVIYYKVGKQPAAVIEVDGGSHMLEEQKERDGLKNSILGKVGLPLLRLKTTEGNIRRKTEEFLENLLLD